MQYGDVLAQEEIKRLLIERVRGNTLPHALLFLGPCGAGTLAMALALAQDLVCIGKLSDDSCGDCRHCHRAQKHIHPDIHFTFPTVGSKALSADFIEPWRKFIERGAYQSIKQWLTSIDAENKQGNITRDECMNVIKTLGLKPFESEVKVQIIFMAEYLGEQGNRLLKVLEEPTGDTIFILIAEQQDLILSTILSRCQILTFKPLPEEEILNYIRRLEPDIEPELAIKAAMYAEGDLTEALWMLEGGGAEGSALMLDWMRVAYKDNGAEIVAWVDRFVKLNKEAQKLLLTYALHFFREMMLLQMRPDRRVRLTDSETTAMKRLSVLVDYDQMRHMIQLTEDNIYNLQRNASARILMMDHTIRLGYLLRGQEQALQQVMGKNLRHGVADHQQQ